MLCAGTGAADYQAACVERSLSPVEPNNSAQAAEASRHHNKHLETKTKSEGQEQAVTSLEEEEGL